MRGRKESVGERKRMERGQMSERVLMSSREWEIMRRSREKWERIFQDLNEIDGKRKEGPKVRQWDRHTHVKRLDQTHES